MEALNLLKFWKMSPTQSVDDREDSFFDLEFNVGQYEEEEEENINISRYSDSSDSEEEHVELKFSGSGSGSGTKPQSPVSFFKSPPKLPMFFLFKRTKPESEGYSPASTPKHLKQSKRFVEEVPMLSVLTRVNSSRRKLQKPKDVVFKYLKLIKPLYVMVSKSSGEKKTNHSSNESYMGSPSSFPAPRKLLEDRQCMRSPSLRIVSRRLGKFRKAGPDSSAGPKCSSSSGDSVLQSDGIQSAILHCKRSYNSSRDSSFLSRCSSEPCHEVTANPSRFAMEEKKRISI